jgi:predicted HicB family RNase H-like nuclease
MTILGKQRVTLFLNPELIKQAKVEAIVEELSLTALIEKALIQYLPVETIIRKTHIVMGSI